MSKQDDGGLAFPALDDSGSGLCLREPGMTLHDYFAAKAMQAAISGHIAHYGHDENYWAPKDIASYASEVAAAMLAELAK